MGGADGDGPGRGERFTVWHGLLLAQGSAALIALLVTLVPSKTGSQRGIPHLFLDAPTFLQALAINFAAVNALLAALAVALALWLWRRPGS